ncbi:glycosyltransferase family 1 protein [Mixia osmundae IAM 14324]|uniref:UDP-N-acetylglucosamine transferase subunit ALG13 n=1 Tax=Mixia osmundae (strain CBS 9802 / IAM 14324 / JCM 22182 / KY 12970) TaxID=764103 RepID=G7DX67_MIXOS|nr:glycosyltransferase family 1 protein [Mixia osmundae IAM 14324]KEI37313.1 glycosyltransferase family 1 protein [Mixia osmundae IAM 14324]GAA95177.1 hypothetical protein E5Q_01832 [Mixia osmundae IAM 14324]
MQDEATTGKTALLTVGSTQFAALAEAALSPDVLHALRSLGYDTFIVQKGDSILSRPTPTVAGLQIDVHDYMDSLDDRMQSCQLVISHAGSGSILAALRGPVGRLCEPKALIIVPNDGLMDNHQSELADKMREQRWALTATPATLAQVILQLGRGDAVQSLPARQASRFRDVLEREVLQF